MNREQAFQMLGSLVYAMEKPENESVRSESSEELEQMLVLMNRDWHELYTIYGKAWKEYRRNALEKQKKKGPFAYGKRFLKR